MKTRSEIMAEVRSIIVESLSVEPEEVIPSAQFFQGLGGESIDMLELTFQCEKRFGVKLPFQQLAALGTAGTDEQGRLTDEALAGMKAKYPFLDYSKFSRQPQDITSLITVEAIVAFVENALLASESLGRKASASPGIA